MNPPSTSSEPVSRIRRIRFFLSALIGYLAVPLLNAVSPLIALPAITSVHGGSAWVAVAIGQSLGGTAGVIVELGWGLNGSQRAARMSRRNQAQTFAMSIVTKAIVGVPIIGASAVLAAVLAPSNGLDAALVALAAGIAMFSAGWIFIGTLRPRLFLFTEVLPRTLLILLAGWMIALGGPLLWYSGALLVAAIAAPIAGAVVLGMKWRYLTLLSPRRAWKVIRFQWSALQVNIYSSLYISLGTTIVTLGSVNASLLYASVDRIQRMYQQVLRTQTYVFKGWVGRETNPGERVRRAIRSTWISAAIGVLSGIVFAISSPWVADLVFSGQVVVSPLVSIIAGLNIAVICASMSSGGVLLVALGRVKSVATSALVGAILGLPAMFFGAMFFGGVGALVGQLVAESAVLVVQLAAARRRVRELRAENRWGLGVVRDEEAVLQPV